MSMPLWFYNLAVYCAQLAILIATGGLMAAATRLREPRARLIYWQALLVLGLLLPVIEPWKAAPPIAPVISDAAASMANAAGVPINSAVSLPVQATPHFSVYQIIGMLLLAGLLLRLLWLAFGMMRLRRSRRQARPLGFHIAVDQLRTALGVSPGVLVSERVSSPVTFGWRTPQIMLPAKFTEMDEARQRAILCHEFLHVRRRDWLWHVAEELLRALFWFHLAVVWLISQIRLCREQVVDRGVVLLAGSRRDYLNALFEIASSSSGPRLAPGLLFLSERHLKRRVTLILKEAAMPRKKLVLAFSACFAGLLLSGALAVTLLPLRTSAAETSSLARLKAPLVRPDTHFYGNPDAKLTVVEFGDFECPACRKAEAVVEETQQSLGAQVRFAYRQFPLTKFHPYAEKAAEASECAADQGKFWEAVKYFSSSQPDLSAAGLEKFAAQLGLDKGQYNRCLSSGNAAARVQQDEKDGRALGVTSVPTFFVGNEKLVGTPSYSSLEAVIKKELSGSSDPQNDPAPGAVAAAGPALVFASAALSDENNYGAYDFNGKQYKYKSDVKVYKVGGKVSAPVPFYKPEPPYTSEARKSHLNGIVVLDCVVDAKGRVMEVKERSKPLGKGLDESAMNTVRTWKFKPAMREGVPVPVEEMIEINFIHFQSDDKDSAAAHLSTSVGDQPAQAKQSAPAAEANTAVPVKVDSAEIARIIEEGQ